MWNTNGMEGIACIWSERERESKKCADGRNLFGYHSWPKTKPKKIAINQVECMILNFFE